MNNQFPNKLRKMQGFESVFRHVSIETKMNGRSI